MAATGSLLPNAAAAAGAARLRVAARVLERLVGTRRRTKAAVAARGDICKGRARLPPWSPAPPPTAWYLVFRKVRPRAAACLHRDHPGHARAAARARPDVQAAAERADAVAHVR